MRLSNRAMRMSKFKFSTMSASLIVELDVTVAPLPRTGVLLKNVSLSDAM